MALTTVQNQMTAMGNSGASYEFVNRIINGAMVIDQRNAGASVTPVNNQYTLDRWFCSLSQASKYTVQQNAGSVTPPTGFINYLGVTSSSAYSSTSGDYFNVAQAIEGLNVADLGWGAAGAASVTLSFWVRSSLTGTFGGALRNADASRSYPFTFTISSANTWTYATVTIAGDTSGTWLKTNGVGVFVHFNLGTGTTYSGTPGVWASANYVSATGAQSIVGTNGATLYITGVQLEKGTTASQYDYRDFGRELMLCQRYYYQIAGNAFNGSIAYPIFGSGGTFSTYQGDMYVPFKTTMRAIPTCAQSGGTAVEVGATGYNVTSLGDAGTTFNTAFIRCNTSGSFGAGAGCVWYGNNNTASYVSFSAEL